MENILGIKKPKYRILWKSFRTSEFQRRPFVFEKDRAERIVGHMEKYERIEEEAKRRKKNLRTEFYILIDLEYISEEVDEPGRVYDIVEYKDRLALLKLKGLI